MKITKIAILVIVVVLLGFITYAWSMYQVAQQIKIKEMTIEDVSLEGVNPLIADFLPDAIRLKLRFLVTNPTDYSAEVTRLHYEVYVENHFLGEGLKENIYIPVHSDKPIYIDFIAETTDVMRVIEDLLRRGDNAIDYKVIGVITTPVKLFNVIRIAKVDIPFEYSGFYILSIPGMKPQIRQLNAYWEQTEVILGNLTKAIIKVTGPLSGVLEVRIMKDIPILADEVVLTKAFEVNVPAGQTQVFEVKFIPEEPTSIKLRGYYIVIYLNKQKVFEQPSNYPPRLKVVKP